MATNLPSCFSFKFLEQLLKFLVNFTLLKYVKSQRIIYGFLITKELIFGFQILDLKDHFSASLICFGFSQNYTLHLKQPKWYNKYSRFRFSRFISMECINENCPGKLLPKLRIHIIFHTFAIKF